MKHDEILITAPSGTAECRICQYQFVPSVPEDRAEHRKIHKGLAQGGMPRKVREFLKGFGWAVAHNDGGIDRQKGQYDPAVGKLAVAYSWWSRARSAGCPEKDFDAYMAAHLKFIEALVTNDAAQICSAEAGIKQWEVFAG